MEKTESAKQQHQGNDPDAKTVLPSKNWRSLRYSMLKLGVFSNRWLLFGVAVMALLQVFFTYSTTMNQLFGSAPLEIAEWTLILTGGLVIYSLVETEKWLRRFADNL